MEIKWRNVIGAGLLVLILVLIIQTGPQLWAVFGAVEGLAPGHAPEEKKVGLMVFGLLLVAGLALVRLLLESDRRDK